MGIEDLAATRSSLLERLKDQEGWNDFFDTYWRLIYNMARQARMNDSEAMDVVQENWRGCNTKAEGVSAELGRGLVRLGA